MKEQFQLELRPSSEQEKCFEGIPLRSKCVFKFVNWFFSVFQSLQMYCNIFCHLADSSSIKTNLEIVIFRQKIHMCSYSGPGISEKTKETRLLVAI